MVRWQASVQYWCHCCATSFGIGNDGVDLSWCSEGKAGEEGGAGSMLMLRWQASVQYSYHCCTTSFGIGNDGVDCVNCGKGGNKVAAGSVLMRDLEDWNRPVRPGSVD